MPAGQPLTFKRLVVLLNPRSSNAALADKVVGALQKSYPGKVRVEAIGKTDAENTTLLKGLLKRGDILVPCGGDGTIGGIVQALLDPDIPKALRGTRVLPVGTGRMNDVARMLNGRYFRDPKYVLSYGHPLKVYPLAGVFTPLSAGQKRLVKLVIYSIGIGYSGNCSLTWNDPKFRANIKKRSAVTRPVEFFKAGTSILRDSEYFDITSRGKRRKVLDVTAAVGHLFGGYYRMPARLSERKFYFIISDDKSFLGTIRNIAGLITNRLSGGELTTSASFTLHDTAVGHVGGETFIPPTPCNVRFTHHPEPITMLATSPKA
jgi:diacylglycerol kinase family enzyme